MGAAWARHGDLSQMRPAEARRVAEIVRAPWADGGPAMALIREIDAPVRMRLYDPSPAEAKPLFVYLHGGGWTLFSLDTHDRVMREYASRANVVVAGVDYPLSPEAKFPAALHEVIAAVEHLARNMEMETMAIGGDSAGANLALAAAIALRDRGRSPIRALVLNYGVFARRPSSAAERDFGGAGQMLTAEEMDGFWRNYLRTESDADDPLACPINADLRRLPPALLIVPECDLLTEQSVELGRRMREAGVDVEMKMYRGATHSFLEAVSISPLASRAFDDTAAWLRQTVSR